MRLFAISTRRIMIRLNLIVPFSLNDLIALQALLDIYKFP